MNSGEILGNHVIVSGAAYAQLRIEWQLASQNVAGNYSTVNYQAYIDFFGCDAQLDNGSVSNNNGVLWSNGGRIYNYAGNFSNHTVTLVTGSFNISHDGSGNCTLNMSGSVAVFSSGTASGSGSWSLPQIQRYAVIDAFNVTHTTDEWIEFVWHADRNCDFITWWSNAYDGGGHHDIAASGQGNWTIDLHNLKSNTPYDITVGVRNAASGLWTFSSTANPTTLLQNNFVRGRTV